MLLCNENVITAHRARLKVPWKRPLVDGAAMLLLPAGACVPVHMGCSVLVCLNAGVSVCSADSVVEKVKNSTV